MGIYIMTQKAMMAFYKRAYDEGKGNRDEAMRIGFEAGKRWAQNKGFIVAGIPYDTLDLDTKVKRQIDDILKDKGVS